MLTFLFHAVRGAVVLVAPLLHLLVARPAHYGPQQSKRRGCQVLPGLHRCYHKGRNDTDGKNDNIMYPIT